MSRKFWFHTLMLTHHYIRSKVTFVSVLRQSQSDV
jgi:hypothetical protein